MSKLNLSDIAHVAKLSKLKLSETELEKYRSQFQEILDYVAKLEEVDTQNTLPTFNTTGLEDITRPDEPDVLSNLPQEKALSEARKSYNNYFEVPGLLDKEQA